MNKEPKDCFDMVDIRTEIDSIDTQIIKLISQRSKYVNKAAQFKTSETSVKAPDRFKSMLLKRREWAIDNELNPDVIETLFKDLVTHFISEEMNKWNSKN